MNNQQPQNCVESALLPTPFDQRTSSCNKQHQWVDWAGYRAASVYDSLEKEYFKIRAQCALFDISPMHKYRVSGPEAEAMLNRMVTRDVRKIRTGRVSYIIWCDNLGHVIDDGTLFRLEDNSFWLCCQEPQYGWLCDQQYGFECQVEECEYHAALSLQGPTSYATLAAMGVKGIAALRAFSILRDDALDVIVSRTGFTGDLGYELWTSADNALNLWDRLFKDGKPFGIASAGLAALDMARLEAGFIQPGVDFISSHLAQRASRGRTPFELGLERLIDFEKGHFNGRRALLTKRHKTPAVKLVALDIEGNKPAHAALVYENKRKEVGTITSAYWSPTCKSNIALAMVKGKAAEQDKLWVEIYHAKELKWERVMARARIVEKPFFKHKRRSATPPASY